MRLSVRFHINVLSVRAAIFSLLLLASPGAGHCGEPNLEQGISSTALEPSLPTSGTGFTLLTPQESGVSHTNVIDSSHQLSRVYITGYGCGGVSVGDLNKDGKADLFVVNGPGKNSLYLQRDKLRFEDVTTQAGVDGGDAWGTGAAMADVDNDGDLDIYVCNYDSAAELYLNDGTAHFTERAGAFGLDLVGACIMPSFSDFDRDGFLDVYLLNNRLIREGGVPEGKVLGFRYGKPYLLPEYEKYYALNKIGPKKYMLTTIGQSDRLLRHNGVGKIPGYTDVTEKAGIYDQAMGLSAIWWDYNDDGFPDLYVANDFEAPDLLWRNNGDGTFTDVLAQSFPHTTWFSMGSDIADINNDGYWDLFAADMLGTTHLRRKLSMGSMNTERIERVAGPPPQLMRNALLVGTGTGRFLEAAYMAGVADSDWTWTVKFADLDNDGLVDIFITNGITRDFMNSDLLGKDQSYGGNTEWGVFKDTPEQPERNLAFKNLGDLAFENVSQSWGLDLLSMSYAAAHADLDRDGDLDLIISNLQQPVSIYRNDHAEGERVLVELRGRSSNHYGIGAVVTLETKEKQQKRQMQPVSGFSSSNEPVIHFGLGEEKKIERLTVRWPSGHHQRFINLVSGQLYRITEPEGKPTDQPSEADSAEKKKALFRRSNLLSQARHTETRFDDFERQPLLPNKLSQLGPGMAWGDVDQDGDDDLFLGGAAGVPGALYVNDDEKGFQQVKTKAFGEDRSAEDMGALFFDADRDGDYDLYVVSGGVEADEDDQVFQDRLYLNDGKGSFVKGPEQALPMIRASGGPVAASDFDGDGDLDLFVGGRVIPGRYPLAPRSFLLRNETKKGHSPRFVDVSERLADGLKEVGMVTSALWSDANGDGRPDLLLTLEWGPVMLWKNVSGKLENETLEAGLSENTGWFNGISGRDLDNDGDIDYVVTNFGLNTKYHATRERPALLYYGRFKGSKENRIIEAEFEDETLYPVRGKGCSTVAIPQLGEEFATFRDFALAPLSKIYSPEGLSAAKRFSASMLESAVLINDGNGRFDIQTLPRLAQISPGFGVSATEVNGDGFADIYLVQNFFTPQIETGRMDSGLSLLLAGHGDGTFSPVWPKDSGLIVPGDAKSLASVDLNGDARIDFVVGLNDDAVQVFQHRGSSQIRYLAVRLNGQAGNLGATGAMVRVIRDDALVQTAEIYAGSGYLSQSSPTLFFGLGESAQVKQVHIRWPNGEEKAVEKPTGNYLRVSQ